MRVMGQSYVGCAGGKCTKDASGVEKVRWFFVERVVFFSWERTEVSLSAASDGRFSLSIAAGLKSFLMDNGFCSTRSVRKRPLRPVACCDTGGGEARRSVVGSLGKKKEPRRFSHEGVSFGAGLALTCLMGWSTVKSMSSYPS